MNGDSRPGQEEGRTPATQVVEAEETDDVMLETPLDLNADISMAEMQMMQAMGIPFVRPHPPCSAWDLSASGM